MAKCRVLRHGSSRTDSKMLEMRSYLSRRSRAPGDSSREMGSSSSRKSTRSQSYSRFSCCLIVHSAHCSLPGLYSQPVIEDDFLGYLSEGQFSCQSASSPSLQLRTHSFGAVKLPATLAVEHALLRQVVNFRAGIPDSATAAIVQLADKRTVERAVKFVVVLSVGVIGRCRSSVDVGTTATWATSPQNMRAG